MTPEKIVENGLPLDYFDHLIIDPDCKNDEVIQDVTKFLKNHVGQLANI
jgi:hypothetical protein